MVAILQDDIDISTRQQLAQFERNFRYPLDAKRSFEISHGPDYLRFFRGLGEVRCFVAREGSRIEGLLTTVKRELWLPGEREPLPALYLCDLKILPGTQRVKTLFRLVQEARQSYETVETARLSAAYGVVMKGTASAPDAYTGALGIPRFEPLADIAILRIPVSSHQPGTALICQPEELVQALHGLSSSRVRAGLSLTRTSSCFPPMGLFSARNSACGILEDTLQSKRLFSEGAELVSAHLSSYAYRQPAEGASIVASALRCCEQRQIPALFLSLPQSQLDEWLAHNHYPEATVTGATIYGLGLPRGLDWNINTSEI